MKRIMVALVAIGAVAMAVPAHADNRRVHPHNIPVRCILHVDRHGNGSIGHCHTL